MVREIDDLTRESIAVACRYAMRSTSGEEISRAEFLTQWSEPLRRFAGEIWDEAHRCERSDSMSAQAAIRHQLVKIGAKATSIEVAGPNQSRLTWYSLRGHLVILQDFADGEHWEIYTSLSAENKASLEEACAALSNLADRSPNKVSSLMK